MSVISQDTFVIPGVVVSNASGGGGGGGIPANLAASTLSLFNSSDADNTITITNPVNERYSKFSTKNTGTYLLTYSTIAGSATGSIQMGNTGVVPGEAVVITATVDNNAAALIITDTGVATSSLTVSSINGMSPNSVAIPANIGVSSLSISNATANGSTIIMTNPLNSRTVRFSNTGNGLYITQTDTAGSTVTGSMDMGNVGTIPGESIAFKIGNITDANAVQIGTTGLITSSITVSSINGASAVTLASLNGIDFAALVSTVAGLPR